MKQSDSTRKPILDCSDKPLVSLGLWSQQNSTATAVMPTCWASLTFEFRYFLFIWINQGEKYKYLWSLQNSHTTAWQIWFPVPFRFLRLKEGRREVAWWFLACLRAEHWEHRCRPSEFSDLLHPQHAEFGGRPGCCGSDMQNSLPTPNPPEETSKVQITWQRELPNQWNHWL